MTLQGLGTSWMIPNRPYRTDEDKAFKHLIENMEDLSEIKHYLCPKSHGNAQACEGCAGFPQCRVGQRALMLLDKATKEKQREKEKALAANAVIRPQINPVNLEVADRVEFRKACETGNAWNYLITVRQLSEGAAREKLAFWVKRYPNITAEFGGKKRIMAKAKQVVIRQQEPQPETPQETPEAPQQQPERQEEAQQQQTGDQEPDASEEKRRRKIEAAKSGTMIRSEKRMDYCRTIITSEDPVAALMAEGYTEHRAKGMIKSWQARWPDLFEGVDVSYLERKKWRDGHTTEEIWDMIKDQPDPVMAYMEIRPCSQSSAKKAVERYRQMFEAEQQPREKPAEPEVFEMADDNDTISLADFLNDIEQEAPQESQTAPEPETQTEEPITAPETPTATPQNSMLAEMEKTYNGLTVERQNLLQSIEEAREQIRKAEERIKCIEDQKEALELCMAAFGAGNHR